MQAHKVLNLCTSVCATLSPINRSAKRRRLACRQFGNSKPSWAWLPVAAPAKTLRPRFSRSRGNRHGDLIRLCTSHGWLESRSFELLKSPALAGLFLCLNHATRSCVTSVTSRFPVCRGPLQHPPRWLIGYCFKKNFHVGTRLALNVVGLY